MPKKDSFLSWNALLASSLQVVLKLLSVADKAPPDVVLAYLLPLPLPLPLPAGTLHLSQEPRPLPPFVPLPTDFSNTGQHPQLSLPFASSLFFFSIYEM